MRIWDVSPGYLNRQSLLGEHRELHGLLNILTEGKSGYSRHPETRRWVGYLPALAFRHRQLSVEMKLRGYTDRTPVPLEAPPMDEKGWPAVFIDEPWNQFRILREKYIGRESGRIPLPETAEDVLQQHEYSVLARGEDARHSFNLIKGKDVAAAAGFLVSLMRQPPTPAGFRKVLDNMKEDLQKSGADTRESNPDLDPGEFLYRISRIALEQNITALAEATAPADLICWSYFLENGIGRD